MRTHGAALATRLPSYAGLVSLQEIFVDCLFLLLLLLYIYILILKLDSRVYLKSCGGGRRCRGGCGATRVATLNRHLWSVALSVSGARAAAPVPRLSGFRVGRVVGRRTGSTWTVLPREMNSYKRYAFFQIPCLL